MRCRRRVGRSGGESCDVVESDGRCLAGLEMTDSETEGIRASRTSGTVTGSGAISCALGRVELSLFFASLSYLHSSTFLVD